MRLICPNCGAQYEVPDDVIPAEGRDVQCSNCSNTWFQAHPSQDSTLVDELDTPSVEPVAAPPDPEPEPDLGPTQRPPQRSIDPEIADVLREEAERERIAREAERSGTLESQPELGLEEAPADEAARRAEQARQRMARMRGEPSSPEAAVAAAGSRRDLLPDIEEINSTLRASGDRKRPAEATDTDLPATKPKTVRKGRSFRRGFVAMILVAAVAVGVYVFGPRIAETIPATAPYVAQYTTDVETARGWLATSVDKALAWLDQMASENLGSGGSEG
ncbi:MAG: zinc-ribbon domain-containing protein [Pseudomonadota bacterium]